MSPINDGYKEIDSVDEAMENYLLSG